MMKVKQKSDNLSFSTVIALAFCAVIASVFFAAMNSHTTGAYGNASEYCNAKYPHPENGSVAEQDKANDKRSTCLLAYDNRIDCNEVQASDYNSQSVLKQVCQAAKEQRQADDDAAQDPDFTIKDGLTCEQAGGAWEFVQEPPQNWCWMKNTSANKDLCERSGGEWKNTVDALPASVLQAYGADAHECHFPPVDVPEQPDTGDDEDGCETSIIPCTDVWGLLNTIIYILTAGVGVLAVGGIVYGAILYTSAGDRSDQVKKAVGIITNVIIGLVAYVAMFAVVQFLIPGGIW